MNIAKAYFVIFCVAFITFIFRFLPFAFCKYLQNNKTLRFVQIFLPGSVMFLLSLYTLKDLSLKQAPYGLFELISVLLVVLIHIKWRNPLLSISLGTGFFVLCKNFF